MNQTISQHTTRTVGVQIMPKVNDYIKLSIYGRPEKVKVLAVHSFHTIDVQRADGRCFRVSGLALG